MLLCLSCVDYCFRVCFFSIEFRNRFGVWGSIRLHGSSSSWTRSSSKRDLRQDDHFPGYHFYHCHTRCLISIAVSLPTTCMSSLPNCHEKPLTPPHPSKTLFGYVTACLALMALLVAGASSFHLQHGYFDISQYYCYLIKCIYILGKRWKAWPFAWCFVPLVPP